MIKTSVVMKILLLCLILTTSGIAQGNFWSTGYVKSWTLDIGVRESGYGVGNMHKDSIDFDVLTHVIMFAASIRSDGSIGFGNLSPLRRGPFNDYVHAKGKPIILSLGGAGNDAFAIAIGDTVRSTTVRNLMALKRGERYDGFDIDIEPVSTSDTSNIRKFVKELYDSLQREQAYYDPAKKPILTAAIYNQASLWARINQYFDQINLMTYDFYGTWFGKCWHNNAPFGAPTDVDIYNVVMTTVESKMNVYINAGIPRSKLGVGADMNGYLWRGGVDAATGNGIIAPRMRWSSAPTKVTYNETPYFTLRKNYIDTLMTRHPEFYHFDQVAKVPYIGLDYAGSANDIYITYQDTTTMREITQLAQQNSIGGIIIWDVGGGYLGPDDFPNAQYPGLVRDPLLQAIKLALRGEQMPTPATPVLLAPSAGATGVSRNPSFLWSTASNATSYFLQVSTNAQFSNLIVSSTLSETTFAASGLQASTLYYWRVQGRNQFGGGTWTATRTFTTVPLPAITGRVFHDSNSDGSEGVNEPSLPGWTIILNGPVGDTVMVGAGGSYAFSDIPLGNYTLRLVSQPLWNQTRPVNPAGYAFTISDAQPTWSGSFGVSSTDSRSVDVVRLWNTISVPVVPGTTVGTTLFPTAVSGFFNFAGEYQAQSTLTPGVGYWVKFNEAQTLAIAGQSFAAETLGLVQGWNLIGMVSNPVIATSPSGENVIPTEPAGIINSSFYVYKGRHISADTLLPGNGYWVSAAQAGSIILNSGAASPTFAETLQGDSPIRLAELTLVDADGAAQVFTFYKEPVGTAAQRSFALPPTPPSGAFDVRMMSDGTGVRGLALGNPEADRLIPVEGQGIRFPAQLTWKSLSPEAPEAQIQIAGGRIDLPNGQTMILDGVTGRTDGSISMTLRLGRQVTSRVPEGFALHQNYPNPFNPNTSIAFTLEAQSEIRLEIYDVLGQKIATAAAGTYDAGTHRVSVDGSRLASGVYYYTLTARTIDGSVNASTRKMLLAR